MDICLSDVGVAQHLHGIVVVVAAHGVRHSARDVVDDFGNVAGVQRVNQCTSPDRALIEMNL